MDGLLVVDKPAGPTSHDVVARVRSASGQRKIGHTGTLDPFATGVLPLLLGRATRLARFIGGRERVYRAVIRFGMATDTGDLTGQPLGPTRKRPEVAALGASLPAFLGRIRQYPPAYSAKKVDGKRAYRLARRGAPVQVPSVWVTIRKLELLEQTPENDFTLELSCSSGTYVRSLAVDLGICMDSAAHVFALRRLACGTLSSEQAVPLAELLDPASVRTHLVPMEQMPLELPGLTLSELEARRFCHGVALALERSAPISTTFCVTAEDGTLLGIGGTGIDAENGVHRLTPQVVLAPSRGA